MEKASGKNTDRAAFKEMMAFVRAGDTVVDESISRIAVCGGAGAFLIPQAKAAGADCFLTGEIHYHDFFENDGLLLCSIGHYESEQFTQELLIKLLAAAFPELTVFKAAKNPAVLYK